MVRSADAHASASFVAVEVARERACTRSTRGPAHSCSGSVKSNIGDGRLTWRRGPDGTIGYELLVGSDPARTPRQINRWGYLREEAGASRRDRVRRDEPVRRAVRGGREQEHEPDRWHPRLQDPATVADRIAGSGHRLRCPRAERPDLRGSRCAVVGSASRVVRDENRSDAPVDRAGLSCGCGQPDGRRTHGGRAKHRKPSTSSAPIPTTASSTICSCDPRSTSTGTRGEGPVIRSSDDRTIPGAEPHDRRGDAVYGCLRR